MKLLSLVMVPLTLVWGQAASDSNLRGSSNSRQLVGTYGPPYMGGCGYHVNACADYDRASNTWSGCGLEAATIYCQKMGYGSKATSAPTMPQDKGSSCLMRRMNVVEAAVGGPDNGPQLVFTGVTCVD